jgi:alkanesulfonate monooxygenase SsuD/methylene tetrahydromethanopterin reductase-like flavin-dependent oxidoreductase (luciferase family)
MEFGLLIPQEGARFADVLAHARLAETMGYDSVWVEDHLRVIAVPDGSPAFEGWTTLTALLARSERVKAGPLVLAEGFRNPAWLANAAATLDHLSDGRLLLGIGAGGYEAEFHSYGYDWVDGPQRAARLDEALSVIDAMWNRVPYTGRYYRCDGTLDCPRPLQQPRPPVWVGGKGDRLLRVAARHADVWNAPLLAPAEVAERASVLAGFAADAGRPMPAVSVYVPVWIDEDGDRARARAERARASDNRNARLYGEVAIAGSPEDAIARIKEYQDVGVTHVVAHFGRADVTTGTELFARAVLPAFV